MEIPDELSELMERIRSTIRAQQSSDGATHETASRPVGPSIPSLLPDPPSFKFPTRKDGDRMAYTIAAAEAASMLPRARQKTAVRPGVPKMLRSLYRNQGGFNGILLETIGRVLEANQLLSRENLQHQARIEALESSVANQHDWMTRVATAHAQQREWMLAVETYLLEMGGSQQEVELRLRLKHAQSSTQGDLSADTQSAGRDDGWIGALQEQIDTVGSHADRLGLHLNNLQQQVDEQGERSSDWHAVSRQTAAYQEFLSQSSHRLEERQHNDASYVKNQLWFLERLMQPLLGNPQSKTPEMHGSANHQAAAELTSVESAEHGLDALYLAFEEVMRGDRSEVKKRAEIYLPYVAAVSAGTVARPVLDFGSGRGEWLELLREQNLVAAGVDLNTCMVQICVERGLQVTLADAIAHLGTMPDASCGMITAFHLIEHLPFPVLIRFLRECRRVLQPGGAAIFETPNPYNVLVGSGYFYHDFTHQRPLPPPSTKFLVEQMGFSKVETLPLHPWDDSDKVHGEEAKELESRFNELFYGPQDYALIAHL